jgi:NADH dehydrogenase
MHGRSRPSLPHVLILGGGFGGLYAARGLRRARVRITLIDRCNHHLFSPLLYQVATASLSPSDVAQPIRWILRRQANARVLMGEARSIDAAARRVTLADGEVITYDFLIVATGVTHTYFGHDEWAALAPGLKGIGDALTIREKFLLSFEAAEREPDPAKRRDILTFVVIGGGPTGVELAGAMAEIARRAMPTEFRAIDTTTARVILVEGRDRLLPTFDASLSKRARADLESLGVDVWLDAKVTAIDEHGVSIGERGERIVTRNVFWAAGVSASPLGATLGAPMDRAGRILVQPDLSVPDRPEVFVIGDLAAIVDPRTGEMVPGVAPAAMQMGRYVARVIAESVEEHRSPKTVIGATGRPAFRYVDKGMLATIGRARAVGTIGRMTFTGYPAWLLWLFVHIMYLIGTRNRIIVLMQWAWAYLRFERGARLITGRGAGDSLRSSRA